MYHKVRYRCPDGALEFFGTWCQRHADDPVQFSDKFFYHSELYGTWRACVEGEPAQFSASFYHKNRMLYRWLGDSVAWTYPPHLGQLEDQYLAAPDGTCVLPAAYTLTYGYWSLGRIQEWIDKLDARLADKQLTGDRRVNWLIARAHAEEIRQGKVSRWPGAHQTLAGRGWIETACLVAQSEPVRLRAYRELIVRLVAEEEIDKAQAQLDRLQGSFSEPAVTGDLATWQGDLDKARARLQQNQVDQAAQAKEAYVEQLRERYQKAVDRDDQAAVTRYGEMLSEAGESLP